MAVRVGRAEDAGGDAVSPNITSMAVGSVTTTTATIYWMTDIASDSQVQYGTTTAYGNFTTLDPTLVTQHSQTLSGLVPGTIYHYFVMSRDVNGDMAPGRDYQFETSTSPNRPPPVVSSVAATNITNSTVTISWVTDWLSDSQVLYGLTASYGSVTTLDPTPAAAIVFPEIDEEGSTLLYVANSAGVPANVQLALVQSDGTTKSSAVRSINPQGALAESALSLFPDAVADVSDFIVALSNVSLSATEILGGFSHDEATLNGIDQSAGTTTLYCPQYLVGSRYRSNLSIVNTGGNDGNLSIRLMGDDRVQIGQTQTTPIKASGKINISDPAFFGLSAGAEVSGYVVVVSDGPSIAGSVVFEDSALATFKTALPLVSQLDASLVFSDVVSNARFFTGMALLNPNDADAVITIELYRADGILDTSANLTIPAHKRISEVLTEIFPNTSTRNINSGYLRISADRGLAGFSVFGTNDMKILAAVPAQVVR